MNWTDGKYPQLSCGPALIQTRSSIRFREIPHFGVDGIRLITTNRSELKKMTAHDFEDMLQVGHYIG